MKKFIFGLIAIVVLVFAVRSWAAIEFENESTDLANQDHIEHYQTGSFAVTNQVLDNGDTASVNAFVPDGGYITVEKKGNAFKQILGGLIAANDINVNAVTNATLGQTGVFIAQEDSTILQDYGVVNSTH